MTLPTVEGPHADVLRGFPPVRFVGPLFDVSGYGEAARHQLWALRAGGARVHAVAIGGSQSMNPSGVTDPLEEAVREICREGEANLREWGEPAVTIYHMTPDLAAKYKEGPGKHVCAMVWETSRLPSEWAEILPREFDQVWVPTSWQLDVMRHSDVVYSRNTSQRIVHLVPFGLDLRWFPVEGPRLPEVPAKPDETIFYTILQWSARKNLEGVLVAYLSAFTAGDPVRLVIKVGGLTRIGASQVHAWVSSVAASMQHPRPPYVQVVPGHHSRDEILALHRSCDVYVSLHRGEGFGLPIAEAALLGNPGIVTNWSGPTWFCSAEGHDLVPYHGTPVVGMQGSPWYRGHEQTWAEPDLSAARRAMRTYVERPFLRRARGVYAQGNVVELTSVRRAVEAMRSAFYTLGMRCAE